MPVRLLPSGAVGLFRQSRPGWARSPRVEWLEPRLFLDGQFGPLTVLHDTIGGPRLAGPVAAVAADLDSDGDMDVAVVSAGGLAWYENLDGSGSFGPLQVISPLRAEETPNLSAHDVDRDGDQDLIVHNGSQFIVYPNYAEFGLGVFFGAIEIDEISPRGALQIGDLDGDGDLDVVGESAQERAVLWWELRSEEGAIVPHVVATVQVPPATTGELHAALADVDGDGDHDVLYASTSSGRLVWREHLDGSGTFAAAENVFGFDGPGSQSIHTADFDGDGDTDLLIASVGSDVRWLENVDGAGLDWSSEPVSAAAVSGIRLSDLDGDGDRDILAIDSDHRGIWFENAGGDRRFSEPRPLGTGESMVTSLSPAQLNCDERVDVVFTTDAVDQVAWMRNDGGGPTTFSRLGVGVAFKTLHVDIEDVDGDHDKDILVIDTTGSVIVYEYDKAIPHPDRT